uniref:FHA domain-containing protein n=1 Tax=Octopus bimaculoides TaxID=37653 RepID=A0A0L8FPH0_OCTBM
MVNVIPCIEAHQENQDEVVISVQGRVGIRLHGTVISEEVDIGDRQIVNNSNGVNYGEGSDIWNQSVELDSRVRNVVNDEEEMTESVRMDAGVEYLTEERGNQVDVEGMMRERDRVDAEGETKERDRVDAEGVTKERDRVDAEGVTKERDRVDAEGVTKERDQVDAEGVTKERDRVDAEGVTKERDRVDAEGVTKERDRVDAEGVMKERDRVDSEVVTKERSSGDTNGVSAKVLTEQNSKLEQKASNYSNNSCSCNQLQHYQSMDETGLSNNRRHLSSVTPHTPTHLTLFYKPSMLSPQVMKYFPKEVIVREKGKHVSFGRNLSSDVQLNDDCMSRNYALLWLPVNDCGTFKLRNISSSKEVVVDDVLLYPNCNSEMIVNNNSKIVLDNIELTAVVRAGSPSATHYEVKIEPTISRSTSLQQEPTW